MISIPKKGTPERERLIEEHKGCVEFDEGGRRLLGARMRDPRGYHVSFRRRPRRPVLKRVLLRMRGTPTKGKLVVICMKVDAEWRIARLSGVRGVPPEFVDDKIYTDEQEIQHDIFLMRLDEMPEEDGNAGAVQRRLEAPRRQLHGDLRRGTICRPGVRTRGLHPSLDRRGLLAANGEPLLDATIGFDGRRPCARCG